MVRKKEIELRKNADVYIQKEEEIKKERKKITDILSKAKQAKLAKIKMDQQASGNNDNINNDVLQPPGGYGDSQQQPKDAYNSALLNTNGNGQQAAAKAGKDTIDNLSASLNYNNLAETLNIDELKSIGNKVKRLASGYGTIQSINNQDQIDKDRITNVRDKLNNDQSDDTLALNAMHKNLLTVNKMKPFDSKNPSLVRFKEKKRKFLK